MIGAFEKIFQTDDLLVSFDAVNVSLAGRLDKKYEEFKPWAHQDQDPERPGFRCIQGFVNLAPNGDNDGGLMVLKGGHLVSEEYHKAFNDEEREFRWTNEVSVLSAWASGPAPLTSVSPAQMYLFKDTGMKWLQDKGLEWVKVTAGPGDLVLCEFRSSLLFYLYELTFFFFCSAGDSRAPHYNVPPRGNQDRFVVYTSFAPVSTATKEDLLQKKWLFENTKGHSHWAQGFQCALPPCVLFRGMLLIPFSVQALRRSLCRPEARRRAGPGQHLEAPPAACSQRTRVPSHGHSLHRRYGVAFLQCFLCQYAVFSPIFLSQSFGTSILELE